MLGDLFTCSGEEVVEHFGELGEPIDGGFYLKEALLDVLIDLDPGGEEVHELVRR